MRSRDRGGCGKPVSDYQPVLVAGAHHVCGGGAPVRGPGDGVAAAGGFHWRYHVPGSNMVSVPSVAFGCFATPDGGGWSLGYRCCRTARHDKIVCNVIIAWVGEASCCGFL